MISFIREQKKFNYRVAAIIIHEGHVLLHRIIDWDTWILPGGRCEMFENSKQTIEREMQEELQIEAQAQRLLWVAENFFYDNGYQFHELGFYYLVSAKSWHEQLDLSEFMVQENDEPQMVFKWFPLTSLKEVPLYPVFLRESLQQLPTTVEHRIVYEERR